MTRTDTSNGTLNRSAGLCHKPASAARLGLAMRPTHYGEVSLYPPKSTFWWKSFCPVADTIEGSSIKEDEMQNLTKEISMRKVIAAEFLSLDGVME
jgi:hypothetical protein